MKKVWILSIIVLLLCSGCNYDIIDLNYDFDTVVCSYGEDHFELEIDSWTDYDGEQIQVESDGKVYLLSANKCYMISK